MSFEKTIRRLFAAVFGALCVVTLACTPPVSSGAPENAALPGPAHFLQNWTTASWSPFTVRDSITGFAWNGSAASPEYAAVSRGGVIGYSTNGTVWQRAKERKTVTGGDGNPTETVVPFADTAAYNGVAYGGGVFVAVGDNDKIAWSRDGEFWEAGTTGVFVNEPINAVAWGAGYFVAVGKSSASGISNIAVSADGSTWIYKAVSQTWNMSLRTVVFGAGKFYIAGDGGNVVCTENPAADGSAWRHYHYNQPSIDTGTITRLAFGKRGNADAVAAIFNDANGKSTRIAVIPAAEFAVINGWDALDTGYFNGNSLNGIVGRNDGAAQFVAAGSGAMIGWWPSGRPDTDRYWRALTFQEFNYWEITALAEMNGRLYAGGIGGKIAFGTIAP
jgi:hypothetical protein